MKNTEYEESIAQMLNKRLEILKEMVRVTKIESFTGDSKTADSEIENYIALMEKREHLLNDVISIDKKLGAPLFECVKNSENQYFRNEANSLIDETKNIVSELLAIDERNNTIVEKLMSHLKNSIKDLKVGKNVNAAYQTEYFGYDGYLIDKMN